MTYTAQTASAASAAAITARLESAITIIQRELDDFFSIQKIDNEGIHLILTWAPIPRESLQECAAKTGLTLRQTEQSLIFYVLDLSDINDEVEPRLVRFAEELRALFSKIRYRAIQEDFSPTEDIMMG